MLDINSREQQYHTLRRSYQARQIDEETFLAAVDDLGFEDEQGIYWMIGAETGHWYYYDGANWRAGTPAPPPVPTVAIGVTPTSQAQPGHDWSTWLMAPSRLILMGGLALAAMLILVLPVRGFPSDAPMPAPSPRPPLGQDGGGGSGGSGGGSGGGGGNPSGAGGAAVIRQSSIRGVLTDASTGQPGSGIEISVSGAIVRTDTDGSYSITGLSSGEYTVSPVLLGQGVPAQEAVYVSLDGVSEVMVDLAYYSDSPPLPTDTPQAVAAVPVSPEMMATPPPTLPDSGAPASPAPLLMLALGGILVFLGGLFYRAR
jgi:hypothetical protein